MKKKVKKISAPSKPKAKVKVLAKKSLGKSAKPLKLKVIAKSKEASKVKEKPSKNLKPETTASVKSAKGEKIPKQAVSLVSKSKLSKEEKKSQVMAQIAAVQKEQEAEVILTNADGKQYCKVHDCDQGQTTDGYCRLHYIALWKRNRSKVKILEGGKLDKYIEDLTSKYPDKYLEMLRKDLSSEKDFNLIISEMDVEDSGDDAETEEDANRFIEEVRGGVPTTDDDDGGF